MVSDLLNTIFHGIKTENSSIRLFLILKGKFILINKSGFNYRLVSLILLSNPNLK